MTKLSVEPLVHETAEVNGSKLGRYTEVGARSRVSETVLDDYSYLGIDCEIWCAEIGKFSNIAIDHLENGAFTGTGGTAKHSTFARFEPEIHTAHDRQLNAGLQMHRECLRQT